MYYQFGIGAMLAAPVGGNASTPSGPVRFGTIQDVGVDIDQKLVELRGQMKGPDDVAPGDMTIKFKSGFGELDIEIWNNLMFGDTVATGMVRAILDEAATIPATPYKVTVTNGANFVADYGVRFALTGAFLDRVASGPTTGQYAVNQTTGEYTFAAADTTLGVLITYTWTDSTNGRTLTVNNHLQGFGPTFSLFLTQPYKSNLSSSNDSALFLPVCRASKMSLPHKRDGYVIADFEGESYPNNLGVWMKWYESDTNDQE